MRVARAALRPPRTLLQEDHQWVWVKVFCSGCWAFRSRSSSCWRSSGDEVAAGLGGRRANAPSCVVLDAGDEAFAAITDFATRNGLGGASLTALGAFERATVGWFDLRAKTYRPIEIDEQCEGLSLLGDIAVGDDGKPEPAHACRARPAGTARRAAAISSRASCGRRLRSPSSRRRRISAAASSRARDRPYRALRISMSAVAPRRCRVFAG